MSTDPTTTDPMACVPLSADPASIDPMSVDPLSERSGIAWRGDRAAAFSRFLPEETAIAITSSGTTHAVMMATPADLDDFALGFALSEGALASPGELLGIETLLWEGGIELRLSLADDAAARLAARRRSIAGPVGCGLCGIDSLEQATRRPPAVERTISLSARALARAARTLAGHQVLNSVTRAMHAAAFWTPERGITLVREDVGRHNALDKLLGALAIQRAAPGGGAIVMTSRLSVELVQKAAIAGAEVLVGVSLPTALAVRVAEAAGLTLVGLARGDGFEVFTHPDRLRFDDAALVRLGAPHRAGAAEHALS